jgi:hypothetical protein
VTNKGLTLKEICRQLVSGQDLVIQELGSNDWDKFRVVSLGEHGYSLTNPDNMGCNITKSLSWCYADRLFVMRPDLSFRDIKTTYNCFGEVQ